jgi:uncharacterized protein YdeI (YjbR/CyaY-like superfamily)
VPDEGTGACCEDERPEREGHQVADHVRRIWGLGAVEDPTRDDRPSPEDPEHAEDRRAHGPLIGFARPRLEIGFRILGRVTRETAKDGKPILAFASQAAWEAWLDAEHAASDGVWLKFAKKGSGVETVVYDEALDIALCYGWIDSQVLRYDEDFYLQKFTPRRSRSKWSRINRDKIERLTKQRRMKPAGLEQVELAKADGRWEAAYASPANVEVPDDLKAALEARPKAAEAWDALSKSSRFAILYQLHDAKRPETRARRLENFVGMLERGEKLS